MTPTAASRIAVPRMVLATVAAALTVAAVLGGGFAHAEPATPPSADQLTTQVSVIFDVNANQAQRTSYLEAGNAGLAVADAVAGPFAQHRSMVSIHVENPVLNGGRLDSQLVMSAMGFGAKRHPLEWVEQGGIWKLSNRSLCDIYNAISRSSNCSL